MNLFGFFEFSGPLIVFVEEEEEDDEVFGNQFVMGVFELFLSVEFGFFLLVEFVLDVEVEEPVSFPLFTFFFLSTFSGSLILMKLPPHLR